MKIDLGDDGVLRLTTETEEDQRKMYEIFRKSMVMPMDKQPENVELIDAGVTCRIGAPLKRAVDDSYGAYTE